MSAAVVILDQELVEGVQDLQVQDQKQINLGCGTSSTNSIHGNCAICFNSIELEETATVKGCEHAYWFVVNLYLFTYEVTALNAWHSESNEERNDYRDLCFTPGKSADWKNA
ncbi:UNVERIFIED_CONTAM: hypothetical protein Sradi_1259100 [Sesamum radiatum]|uniref:Uncharacterized protein n=1 Tax=Sesamum radiatum TaxID=300843 RepID=A0AAW2UR06_SESRA